jgi:hypothetical protein
LRCTRDISAADVARLLRERESGAIANIREGRKEGKGKERRGKGREREAFAARLKYKVLRTFWYLDRGS